jgi:uncharacterized membrane protein
MNALPNRFLFAGAANHYTFVLPIDFTYPAVRGVTVILPCQIRGNRFISIRDDFMVDVLTEITINKPLNEVADYAANPENAPVWYENIKGAEWVTPKQLAVGSRIAFKAEFIGRKLSYTYEITNYIPGEMLVMRTAEGPFPMETTYTWKPVAEGQTLMTLRNRGNPSGFSKIFAPVMAWMMRKENKKDLRKIKEILERK